MNKIPKEVKEEVIKRDDGKCRICGRPYEHIHHIFTRNSFIPVFLNLERVKKNNNVENLVCLCSKCHNKIHNYGMKHDEKIKMVEKLKGGNNGTY